ncbi:MAG: hypothetical protein JRG96_06380 [Deltaproteobacteria bacterium]|nr:hypothetical protein [Deltaproteobacteria bacterium]MBW2418312.1 hypothetical protein [Deltaproteobacteria bacterium]
MESRPSTPSEARHVLALASRNKREANELLAGLPLDEQVRLVCEAPLSKRTAILELTPEPEAVIPLIPEAELCFTVKATGISDASWLMEYATPEQIAACVDLDVWQGMTPVARSFESWLAVFAEAGEETLLRSAQILDTELVVLYLRAAVEVSLKPNDDESWQPPEGGQTLDGQFYLVPRDPADDIAPLLRLLSVLFRRDYWLYFRMLQGAIWELESDLGEWALRWRTGRLEELGFPAWDEAMRIYGFVRPDQRGEIPAASHPLDIEAWHLPVWMPELPAVGKRQLAIFRAAGELDEGERSAFFFAFVSMANKVAIADRMPLGDADTLPAAIEKVAIVASSGLEYVATQNHLGLPEVLRRATLERLFRVGASLDPEAVRPPPLEADIQEDGEQGDGEDPVAR